VPRRDCRIVVLDGGGRGLTSPALAAQLGRWRDAGTATVAFLIGGAAGHGAAALARADLVLSLGPPTWPHLLVRGLVAEQLYRAQQILAGHPYHRA
jgi:23S rRNA (pseudouridine1915-N3)-methyltransferase